jgi:hypothetical protein
MSRVGQNLIYMRCMYFIFGRDITKYTVICGAFALGRCYVDICMYVSHEAQKWHLLDYPYKQRFSRPYSQMIMLKID